jgi:hypothetical protein
MVCFVASFVAALSVAAATATRFFFALCVVAT